ncbi:DM13 domain-containing protein [Oceaniglobus ichthyenteri]|uniref:DM13 domain-containing protein n=1 Tax=Oceaniglobus ichthyenteri TaxID=2136177 RepID=UPI000D3B764B|nr:DM13 domain-containing protein [Oceaniglobus ichthyenteri]
MRWTFRLLTHLVALTIGVALGIYMLPILTAPDSADPAVLAETAQDALFTGTFVRELPGSDFLHWGEGTISLTETRIIHQGALAPGPDYKLYLVSDFVDTEAQFEAIKDRALQIGDVKTFDGFMLDIPAGIDIGDYTTVLIWCEAFSEFITAAKYR